MLLKGTLQHTRFKEAANAAQVCAMQAEPGTAHERGRRAE